MFCLLSMLVLLHNILSVATMKPNRTQYANQGSDVMMTFPFETLGPALRCLRNKTILLNTDQINPTLDGSTRSRIYRYDNQLEIKNFTEMLSIAIYTCINQINMTVVTYGIDVKVDIQNSIRRNKVDATRVVIGRGDITRNTGTAKNVAVLVCVFVLIFLVVLLLYYYRRAANKHLTLNQRVHDIPQGVQDEVDENEMHAGGNTLEHQFSQYENLSAGAHEHIYYEVD